MKMRPLVLAAAGLLVIVMQWWSLQGSLEAETPLDYLRDALYFRTGTGKPVGPPRETISRSQAMSLVSDLSIVKVAFVEYLRTNGTLPRKVADIGVGESLPKNFHLLANGSLEVLIDGKPNARVYWRLVPKSSGPEAWECISPDIANLPERLEDCRYNPSFKKDEPIRIDYKVEHWLLFEFDHSDEKGLTQGAREGFQRFLGQVTPLPTQQVLNVQLTGYADPMGDAKRNVRLAEARAAYAREAFVALGIDRSQINIRVIGADPKPARACPDNIPREERIHCFAPSRRVDVAVTVRKDV
jgi:outer membrane protein OmpA-like peptidoglycan-associated protein